MNENIAAAFANIAKLNRSQVFEDNRLLPITSVDDAMQAAPGWVGPNWANGSLLIGINPGGGGDRYHKNSTDEAHYKACRALKNASGPVAQITALSELSKIAMSAHRTYNIWRIIAPILTTVGQPQDASAFMNIVPFRTREDGAPRQNEVRNALLGATLAAIGELAPQRVIALGSKAYNAIIKQPSVQHLPILEFKRRRGDSSIHPAAMLVLQQLAKS